MAGWESLRIDLLRYLEDLPGALVVLPSPHTERRHEQRFRIQLAAWAVGVADELQAKYGDLVELQVGAMTFPGGQLVVSQHALELFGEPAEAAGLSVETLAPLRIRSGYFAKLDVLVRNHAAHPQVLLTSGDLHTAVTDSSGQVVGRYAGPHNAPRIGFPLEPGQSRPVPALVGTASLAPELGYAVPPGQWSLVVSLRTETSGHLLAAPLDLTVTP
ncbi:MAG TPA: hypothetical protein VG497_25610 [Kribbella sp.]|nr:hypothetical protein [Kribbella sp.]